MNSTSRVFISAPGNLDLRPLLDELRRRGNEPYVLSDVAALGTSLLQSVQQAIEDADQVLVVLGEPAALNPVFEAGLAVGLGKPLLVIAPPETAVPSDVSSLVIIRASADDIKAVSFALDHLQQRNPQRSYRALAPTSRPIGPAEAGLLLERLQVPGLTERSAISTLVDAIEASGGVAAVGAGQDSGFDIGVWSDDLEAIGGNPLLIELKRTLTPGAVNQVLRNLTQHPTARLALLVYLEPAPATASSLASLERARYPILVISLQQLIERMASASFAEVVRDMRNRLAHGLSPS